MKRKIIGYYRDEQGDWVAELDCGHGQHVRHQPPFINRPWVTTAAGRREKLGMVLNCIKCDHPEQGGGSNNACFFEKFLSVIEFPTLLWTIFRRALL